MATVGELYQKKWQEAWDRQVPGAKGVSFTDEAHRCMDAAVPGIWDAEVLEGEFMPGYGMCYDADEPDAGPAGVFVDRGYEDLESWFEEKAVRAGRFRVIVLKEE